MQANKWPKTLLPLTAEQESISNNFMQYWHEVLASSVVYKALEYFNHQYVIKNGPQQFLKVLEIGAGLGEHLRYEKLSSVQKENYVALELRQNMADHIKNKFSEISTIVGDCQQALPYTDGYFDRIIAIHVLEHLPNLPATIKEMHRLCNKEKGFFSIVIPCEGGLAYGLARKISAQRIFERRYKQSYRWFIEREHINLPHEIFQELDPYFDVQHRSFFPLLIPSIACNLCIGVTLRPKNI